MAKEMIKVLGVTKYFDDFRALNNLCLNVEKGSIYGLVGPNGAGKTTIINHLTGAYSSDRGKIEIDGEDIFENENLKQKVISIADDWFYFGTYSVLEMKGFYKDIYKNFSEERYQGLKEVFGIDEKRQIRKFSKGMKKQAAFWLALSAMPEVLILDEPLDGLDPVMRKQVLSLIISGVAEREMTVLVSSHNLRELEDICDHVGIIFNGKMVVEKALDDLKGSVKKFQVVLSDDDVVELEKEIKILHKSKLGSVYSLIIRDETGSAESFIKRFINGC